MYLTELEAIIVLLAILFVCTACEKETVDPPQKYEGLFGVWHMHHDVNGVSSDTWTVNGQGCMTNCHYSYDLTIHGLERGKIEILSSGYRYKTYKFYLSLTEDSLHISYDRWNHDVPPMLPAFGWHRYLHYEMDGQEVLMLGYQQWLR